MKKFLFLFTTIISPFLIKVQDGDAPKDTSWKTSYRATAPKVNDLVHTKLDVKFDYAKSYMYGKEWVTLHPHFYPTDTLTLDAKGMDIKEVALMKGTSKSPLKYSYDGYILKITLDKKYKSGEKYTVYIDYTSKPDEFKAKGSAAITNAKGLYFINPRGEEKDKPTQIWTQGETDDKVLSSSSSGYLIISKLQEGAYKVVVGFPRNEWPEQQVTLRVEKKRCRVSG